MSDQRDTKITMPHERWAGFRDKAFQGAIGEAQLTDMKRAFYAGMGEQLELSMQIAEMIPDEVDGAAVLELASKQISEHILAIALRGGELTDADRARIDGPHEADEIAPGRIPDTCRVADCEGESAYQIGFDIQAPGLPPGSSIHAWTGFTECDAHKGYATKETIFENPDSPQWQAICQTVGQAGGRPDWATVAIKRRGL